MKNSEKQTVSIPRVLFAGISSGCGKTTVTCALLQALVNRGMNIHAFKCGPDYIDPMFHEKAIGAKGSNLDPFFYTENTLRYLLAKNAENAELSLLEGVMGYYDGGLTSMEYSTYEVACMTQTPAVLIVNCKGMGYSVTALIRGFLTAVPDSGICGVILNNVSAMSYKVLKEVIETEFAGKVRVYGYLPPMKNCSFESRHLGLVTASEISDIKEKLNRLAQAAEECMDLDGLIALAKGSCPLTYEPAAVKEMPKETVRIGVAMDKAFCFYYRDNLELLERLGARLIPFSPLTDEKLPECDGLYLGGGYPELYKEQLSANQKMRDAIREALHKKIPCIAECGGFMYLTESIEGMPMVGVIPGDCENKGKLVRFGYITLTAQKDNLLCRAGEQIRAHEFHHYDAKDPGDAFTAQKRTGKPWNCVHTTDTLYAGYPHLPFYSNTAFAENFIAAAAAYQRGR